MPFKKILVPTDFSGHAKAAVETALEFASVFGAQVHLIHAYYFDIPPSYIAGDATSFMNVQDILDPIRESAQESVAALIKEVGSDGTNIRGRVLMGHPAQVILNEAEELKADLIVMGTRGLTGLKHVFLGSTAERVVRLAPCPVVTVKAEAPH